MEYESIQKLDLEQGDLVRIKTSDETSIVKTVYYNQNIFSYISINKSPKTRRILLKKINSLEKITRKS